MSEHKPEPKIGGMTRAEWESSIRRSLRDQLQDDALLDAAFAAESLREQLAEAQKELEWSWQFSCPVHGRMFYSTVRTDKTCGVVDGFDQCKRLLNRSDPLVDQLALRDAEVERLRNELQRVTTSYHRARRAAISNPVKSKQEA